MTITASLDSPATCDDMKGAKLIKHELRDAMRVALISVAVGLMLTLLNPTLYGLIDNLVYSLCIGQCINAGITLVSRWSGAEAENRSFGYLLIRGIVVVPIGLFVGLNLAALLRGNPTGLAVLNHAAIFALPVTMITSIGVTYFFWSRARLADAATAHAEVQRLMAEARLKMLQAQIEPHMLFNTLANLRTLVDVDPQRAQAMIDQLIVYLRGTLVASRNTTTTLAQEFTQLRAYLELMQVRMATRLRFELDLPDALRDVAVPPMLLQPLVENAIRHGLEPKIAGGTIAVSASTTNGMLTVDVSDDGVGLTDESTEPGYGLVHVRERLQTLHGDAGRLTIEPVAGGGVRARVVLPRGTP
jgi:signal transduction histidine kinase